MSNEFSVKATIDLHEMDHEDLAELCDKCFSEMSSSEKEDFMRLNLYEADDDDIANLKELVKPSSLRDFAEHLHKRYFIDDKQRAQLIEKFATMTFADSHNPELVTEALPQIKTMVDAIINCQYTEKPISKTEEI